MDSVIDIAKDFSTFPAGRFVTDGPFSGEAFREQLLLPRMRSGNVDIVLDGAHGLPTSFLEEAFGGLVREGFSPDDLRRRMRVIANTPRMERYPLLIWDLIVKAGCETLGV